MGWISGEKIEGEEGQVLAALQEQLGDKVGVTLNGNRLTMRFHSNGRLVQVCTIITDISTPSEVDEEIAESKRRELFLSKFGKKFPELEAELYYIEEGEYPK